MRTGIQWKSSTYSKIKLFFNSNVYLRVKINFNFLKDTRMVKCLMLYEFQASITSQGEQDFIQARILEYYGTLVTCRFGGKNMLEK